MFTSAKFRNFKSLKDFTVPLKRVNILVGPNNAGKSSVLDAFRALEHFPFFVNRRDSQGGANKILWSSQDEEAGNGVFERFTTSSDPGC
jgi:predicted ATPase